MARAKTKPPDLMELVRAYRRSAGRRPETHVAVPLPPAPVRLARALEPIVRDAGQERLVDALELTRVFSLADLGAAEAGEERPELPPAAPSPLDPDLRAVPLFGELSAAACAELARSCHRRELASGEIVFYEGQPARSFFIVVEGDLQAVRARGRRSPVPTPFRRVGPGELLGVFGLFAGRRRAATVRAASGAVLLEVPGTALARLVKRHASARIALRRFYQERLLTVFLASSPLFAEIPDAERPAVTARFTSVDVAAREILVSTGEVTNGLFLVMNGQVVLRRQPKGEKPTEIARLTRGQFFGHVSALVGTPTSVAAVAATPCSLALLSHRAFAELLRDQPELKQLPERLRAEGLLVARDVFVGDTGVPGLAA